MKEYGFNKYPLTLHIIIQMILFLGILFSLIYFTDNEPYAYIFGVVSAPVFYGIIVNAKAKHIITKTRIKKTSINFSREIKYKDIKVIRFNRLTKSLYLKDVNGKFLGLNSALEDYKSIYTKIFIGIQDKNPNIIMNKKFETFIKRSLNK